MSMTLIYEDYASIFNEKIDQKLHQDFESKEIFQRIDWYVLYTNNWVGFGMRGACWILNFNKYNFSLFKFLDEMVWYYDNIGKWILH